jgi:hypothetical protein
MGWKSRSWVLESCDQVPIASSSVRNPEIRDIRRRFLGYFRDRQDIGKL